MNKVLLNYILKNFFQHFIVLVLIIYGFGFILNLFEEIEFFKESNANIFQPLILSSLFIPSLIIKLLPFIIFFSSMWFITKIKNNKDLLILKVYGFSNLKIFSILFRFFLLPIHSIILKRTLPNKIVFIKSRTLLKIL